MLQFYFYLNAALYAVLAIWCTVSHLKTSHALGYVELNRSGQSEYLVVYGGRQLGLAAFYIYLAQYPAAVGRVGVFFSVMLYLPIVIYRLVTVVRFSPVSAITWGAGALELLLLLGALFLWWRGAGLV
jgi:hypothetical protein